MKSASRYVDSENVVHYSGPSVAVNSGLCGNNDCEDEVLDDVDCRACLAIVEYVRSNGRKG